MDTCTLADRVRDIIVTERTAGNVYSRLLDDFLISLPAVRDATAVGLPGHDGRETVHVVLVPQEPAGVPDFGQLTRQIVDALGDVYTAASYSIAESLPHYPRQDRQEGPARDPAESPGSDDLDVLLRFRRRSSRSWLTL